MAYRVKITPRAQRDLWSIYKRIGTSEAARLWYLGLREAIRSLGNDPGRSPITQEDEDLRHLLYGRKPHVYRVIYRILNRQKVVEVLHIRHGARTGFLPEELS